MARAYRYTVQRQFRLQCAKRHSSATDAPTSDRAEHSTSSRLEISERWLRRRREGDCRQRPALLPDQDVAHVGGGGGGRRQLGDSAVCHRVSIKVKFSTPAGGNLKPHSHDVLAACVKMSPLPQASNDRVGSGNRRHQRGTRRRRYQRASSAATRLQGAERVAD